MHFLSANRNKYGLSAIRLGWRWLLLLLAPLLATGSPDKPLILRAQPQALPTAQFRVVEVLDERPDRRAVAWLLPQSLPNAAPATPRLVDLQGGTAGALRQFLAQSLPQNAGLRPLRLRVRELRVVETAALNNRIEGRVRLQLAFEWLRPAAPPLLLTTYQGGARYNRTATDAAVVEPALRQALIDALHHLNGWLQQATTLDARLATAVRPTFRNDQRQDEPDTLFYDPARPLRWADFTGPVRSGTYAAAVFPSFSYQGRPRLRNGIIELELTLQVFVVRSSSWVGPRQQTAYSLNHEQRHFDLVKLIAERFRRKATADSLTVADYNSILQLHYLKSFTEMNRLQEQYDAETQHGLDTAAQNRWNHRIEEELQRFGVRS